MREKQAAAEKNHYLERSIKSKPLGPTVQANKNIDSNGVFHYKDKL